MISTGANLTDADGFHDDGWCWPQTLLRLQALQDASELRLGVWLKPETDKAQRALFTVSMDSGPAQAVFVELNTQTDILMPIDVKSGQEFTVRISTPHRASRGEDARDLSFILSTITLL